MGNCYTLCRPVRRSSTGLDKVLRIVKSDGKILEYRAPILVRDVLATFADDYGEILGISKEVSSKPDQSLPPGYELKIGHVYYLFPSSAAAATTFPPICDQKRQIKICITKKQLQELLSKTVTMEELLSNSTGLDDDQKVVWEGVDSFTSCWRPKLETILEGCE
ncbi:uncharacterized protein LOC122655951 [Telopea speciosissima]|uniref:uncharacterized protein LOC122655951 n=1 Tax=Telopea speciosissima TaxID=54955 RepID=UPI001CC78961|nr:uncharacterized protein LOC122655951 [Telopea speciosissima]